MLFRSVRMRLSVAQRAGARGPFELFNSPEGFGGDKEKKEEKSDKENGEDNKKDDDSKDD